MTFPWLTVGIAVPVAGAALMRASKPSRGLAVGGALAGLVPPVAAVATRPLQETWLLDPWRVGGIPLLGADALSLHLIVAAALVMLLVVSAAPASEMRSSTMSAMFLRQALVVATFSAMHVTLLLTAWCALAIPVMLALRTAGAPALVRRTFRVLVGGGTVPVAVAAIALAALGRPEFNDIRTVGDAELGRIMQGAIAFALLIGALSRMGLVPLHSWFPLLLTEAPVTIALPVTSAFSGAYLIARLEVPLGAASSGGWPLVALAVIGSIYAALLALSARRVRSAIAYLATSQTALVLLGFSTGEQSAMSGAIVFAVATGFASAGLVVTARALNARVGTIELDRFHGHYRAFPRLAALHFIFGLALIGFPGFASYVGEELVFEGEGRRHLAVAISVVLVTAINGVSFFRVFARAFLGPPPRARSLTPDLHPRKRFVLASVLVALVVFGSYPLTALRHSAHIETPSSAPFRR